MKTLSPITRTSIWILQGLFLTLAFSSCTYPGVNPSKPAATLGYIDFHQFGQDGDHLQWILSEMTTTNYTKIGTRVGKNTFIRLARTPGSHDFSICIVRGDEPSHFASERTSITVLAEAGMVTPVRIACKVTGATKVNAVVAEDVSPYINKTVVRTTYGLIDDPVYTVEATPDPAIPFKRKSEMPYYQPQPLF